MAPRPTAMAALALGCLSLGALAGCGRLIPRRGELSHAAFPISLPAVRTQPDLGTPVGVALVAPGLGYVASDTGRPATAPRGVVMTGSGAVSMTADAGHSWRSVWSERGVYLGWLGLTGSELVATGTEFPTSGPGSEFGSPVLLLGSQDGAHWRLIHPTLPGSDGGWGTAAVEWVSSTLAFAGTAPAYNGSIAQPLLVSRDGGVVWSIVRLPGGSSTGGISAVSDSAIFATGSVTKATQACVSAIWKSTDTGAEWSMLPGSCAPAPLYSVQFLTASSGFAGGGQLPAYSQPPARVLLATTDAGTSWSVRSEQTGTVNLSSPIVQLHFTTNELGAVVTGGCTAGANGPCGGHVYTTSDGGRSLHRTAQEGTDLSAVGSADLWVVDYPGPQVMASSDGGTDWTALPGIGAAGIEAISFQSGSLVLSTSVGTYASATGGRSWTLVGPTDVAGYAPPSVVILDGATVLVEPLRGPGPAGVVSLRASAAEGLAAAVFATPRDGITFGIGAQCLKPSIRPTPAPVFGTSDGGLVWQRLATLDMSVTQAAYSGAIAVAIGSERCQGAIAVSLDAGLQWRITAIPSECQDPSITAAGGVWLTCAPSGPGGFGYLASGRPAAPLANRHRLEGLALGALFVTSADGELYAVGADHGSNVLWVSDDGGRTWRGSLLSLPGG